ncbi:MAG: GNAT family N-acetyltransferase [Acidobacteriales bacterium]|nr:GNAT family N-acetyltransferase [Terriglobales bacterium]
MATVRQSVPDTVEVLDLRHYHSRDLRELMALETAQWARSMSWDYRSSAEMILRYLDSKILPGYAALENGRVVGYSFFVYEGSKGVVGDLFVATGGPDRDEAIRERLLTHVIETLQQTPGVHRVEAQLLIHDTNTVDTTFMREGFVQHPRLFMHLPLRGPMPVSIADPREFEFRRWQEGDFQQAAPLITAAYQGHVDASINDQYRTIAGSMRFLNNIVRFPGCGTFDPWASLVAHHRHTGQMVGVLLCSRIRDDVGHVTQVCLLPEYRGRRVGERLLAECCHELRRRDFSEISLTVTGANTSAVRLYRRMGFSTRRVFDAFVWEG